MVSCGSGNNQGDNYGDLVASPLGLILTPHEHRGGWGRADCLTCHPLENIHVTNNSSVPGIDMQQVRNQTVQAGEASCPICHGTNGANGDLGCNTCHAGGIPDKIYNR
jgi:hypothetical protein